MLFPASVSLQLALFIIPLLACFGEKKKKEKTWSQWGKGTNKQEYLGALSELCQARADVSENHKTGPRFLGRSWTQG